VRLGQRQGMETVELEFHLKVSGASRGGGKTKAGFKQ
jgi:hypothetical protein